MSRNVRRKALNRALLPALTVAALWLAQPVHASDPLSVVVDQATILKMPQGVSTIIIGNPLIADATIQAGGLMIVTGKGYGTTNLILLDRAGKPLMDRTIEVRGPADTVLVYRGAARESYSCAPNCERRIALGDAPEFFAQTLTQTGTRNSSAAATAQPK
jgi:Flp pilus assembly secretin CpaC